MVKIINFLAALVAVVQFLVWLPNAVLRPAGEAIGDAASPLRDIFVSDVAIIAVLLAVYFSLQFLRAEFWCRIIANATVMSRRPGYMIILGAISAACAILVYKYSLIPIGIVGANPNWQFCLFIYFAYLIDLMTMRRIWGRFASRGEEEDSILFPFALVQGIEYLVPALCSAYIVKWM